MRKRDSRLYTPIYTLLCVPFKFSDSIHPLPQTQMISHGGAELKRSFQFSQKTELRNRLVERPLTSTTACNFRRSLSKLISKLASMEVFWPHVTVL